MKTTIKSAIIALALAVTVSASANSYMFNTNLRQGQRGADVTALQTRLGVTPATGFFGPITKNAVMTYQRTNNISPVSGFVGPLTRASLNSTTSTTPTVPGTNPTTPVVLNGMEGTGIFKLGVRPVDNSNVNINMNVPVYSVEVEAKNADISMERITLDVKVKRGSSAENPSTLINSISVKDGSTVLATIPVNSSTFTRNTGDTETYNTQISGISTRVAKDTIKTFTVEFNTNSIDSARDVTVNIPAGGIRVVDGRGISTYNSLTEAVGPRVHTFVRPGTSALSLQSDSVIVYSQNYVSTLTDGVRDALTSTFALKSTEGVSKVTSVSVSVASSSPVSNVYLYQGSNLISSKSLSGVSSVVFDIERNNITVAKGQTSVFSIKVDVAATTTAVTASTTVTAVQFEKADGSTAPATGSSVSGPTHYFARIVPVFAKVSSEITFPIEDGKLQSIAPAFVVDITPMGGSLATTTKATIALVNASGVVQGSAVEVVGALADTGLTNLSEGSVRRVTFANGFATSTVALGTNYKAIITQIKWTPTGGSEVTQTNSFSGLDTSFRIR